MFRIDYYIIVIQDIVCGDARSRRTAILYKYDLRGLV